MAADPSPGAGSRRIMTQQDRSPHSARSWPLLLLLVLTLAAFAVALLAPYRLDTDTAFQLQSVQQWVQGSVPVPGFLRLADPRDLSRDTLLWSNWFPPGFPYLYAPLVASGLPFAGALRATSLLLFLLGGLGWLRLSGRIEMSRTVRLLSVLALAGYAVTIGGAGSLRTADVVAWAAAPWLIALALRCGAGERHATGLFFAGLALGATYWLRYSLFLIALALLAWVAARTAFAKSGSLGGRAGRLAVLGIGFGLPVAALFGLHLRFSDNLTESVTGTRSAWVIDDKTPVQPLRLAVSLAGAPGLGLFQNDLWIHHLVFFSDARLPFLRGMSNADRLLLKSLLGIPGTAVLAWGLARAYRRRTEPAAQLAALAAATAVGFYLALTAVSTLVGYNYLINEVRFAAGFLPLGYPFVLSGWLDGRGRLGRIGGGLLLAVLFVAPLLFVAAVFAKDDLRDRRVPPYTAAASGLFTPELSRHDAAEVQAAVAAVVAAGRSPRDLVVLAGPRGWGSSFVMWLDVPRRVFPVSTYVAPLGNRFLDAADLNSRTPLRSSQPLRVVLVTSRALADDGSLAALESRFPQAGAWQSAPVPADAAVTISWSDLDPNRPERRPEALRP